MANQLQFGNKVVFLNGLPFTLPIATSDPGSAVAGDLYYNSVSNTVRYYNGTAWAPIAAQLSGLPLNANNVIVGNISNLSTAVDSNASGDILVDSSSGLTIKNAVIFNAMVAPSAAIAYSKLNLSSSIVDSDVNASAAIAYGKLALTNSIVDSDVNASAAIAYGKLNLLNSIVNADINSAAAIAYSKLALTNSVVDADINASAAIAYSKLAVLGGSTNSVLIQNGSGFVSASGILSTNLFLADGSVPATGDFNLNSHKIISLASGSVSTDAVNYGQVILVSGANAFAADQSMGGFKLTNVANGTLANDAVNFSQLSAITSGLIWQQSVRDPDLVDDSLSTPPISPVFSITYIIAAAPTGAWTGLAGHAVWWDGADWHDVSTNAMAVSGQGSPVQVGDRFAVAIGTAGAAAHIGGGLTGKANYLVQITNNTPGSIAYTFIAPVASYAVNVSDVGSQHYGSAYTYSGSLSTWIDFSGPSKVTAGNALAYDGNILNVQFDGVTIDLTGNQLEVKAGGITNTQVSASAAIAYSKLALTNSIVNADINSAAAIAYSKLALTNSIVNADINAAAAIAYSKLNLSNSIVNADINTAAAIARSKLASGTAFAWVTNNVSGVMQDTPVTANRAVATDANGLPTASATTATELGFLSGVTSSIQTQLSGKANTALSNLAAVAINTSLLPGVDNSITNGSASFAWQNVFTYALTGSASADLSVNSANNKNVTLNANGTGNVNIEATLINRSQAGSDASNFMQDQYYDSQALAANVSSPTQIPNLFWVAANFDSAIINYKIKEATTNKIRVGQFIVTCDGSIVSYSDQYSETAILGSAAGLQLSATLSGGNIQVLYNNTSAANGATMRVHIRRLRA